eukprot:XP_005639762.1 iroquois-class homeodomain protein IRX-1 [Canis lupus familiaris]
MCRAPGGEEDLPRSSEPQRGPGACPERRVHGSVLSLFRPTTDEREEGREGERGTEERTACPRAGGGAAAGRRPPRNGDFPAKTVPTPASKNLSRRLPGCPGSKFSQLQKPAELGRLPRLHCRVTREDLGARGRRAAPRRGAPGCAPARGSGDAEAAPPQRPGRCPPARIHFPWSDCKVALKLRAPGELRAGAGGPGAGEAAPLALLLPSGFEKKGYFSESGPSCLSDRSLSKKISSHFVLAAGDAREAMRDLQGVCICYWSPSSSRKRRLRILTPYFLPGWCTGGLPVLQRTRAAAPPIPSFGDSLRSLSLFFSLSSLHPGSPSLPPLVALWLQGSQYELKDNPGVHPATFAAHTAPAYYPYGQFQYGDPGRPKNATRESTSTLKAWLNEHRKNPYPTKGEKIMLAIITKMTLTQVSTWFANARRRLKKENKVTWGARSKDQEDGALFGSDTEGDPEKAEDDEEIDLESIDIDKIDEHDGDQSNEDDEDKAEAPRGPPAPTALARDQGSPLAAADALKSQDSPLGLVKEGPEPGSTRLLSPGAAAGGLQGAPHSKPKIWSLAETATSPDGAPKASPPPPAGHPGAHGPPAGTPLQHPAFLPSHGLYTCHIGKFSNWTNGAFLAQGSLLNMRSFLGVGEPHGWGRGWSTSAAASPPPRPKAHTCLLTLCFSPSLAERDLVPRPDSPAQQLKSPFQPVRDNSLAPQEGTPRILAALPSA